MNSMYEGKVALITGSTHGIGEAIAVELAKIGFFVTINGTSTNEIPEKLKNTLHEIYKKEPEQKFVYIQADVGQKEGREKLVTETKKKFGRIDVLVNNAGVAPKVRQDILETNEESYDWVMSVNLKGPYFLTQAVAKWMIELKSKLKEYQPYIINISSINRYTSSTNRGEYCVSKAGMTMVTTLFADRLAEHGIPVYEISPGIVETPLTEKVHEKYDKLIKAGAVPMKRWGQPVDIAKPVVAIVSGLLPFCTGAVIDVDGGFHIHRI